MNMDDNQANIETPKSLDELLGTPTPTTQKLDVAALIANESLPPTVETTPSAGEVTERLQKNQNPQLAILNLRSHAAMENYFRIEAEQILIGRDPNATLKLMHPSVSQRHAQLEKRGQQYVLVDLQSTNGSRINGALISTQALHCYDIIELGDVQLQYLEGNAQTKLKAHNVVEVQLDPEFVGLTQKPPRQASALMRPALLSLTLLLLTWWVWPNPQKRVTPVTSAATTAIIPAALDENMRIIQHQISQARSLMQQQRYEEAKIKAELILTKLDAHNTEAQLLIEEVQRLTHLEAEREATATANIAMQSSRLKNLMTLAGRAVDQKMYVEAKDIYRQILALQPQHAAALAGLDKIQQLQTAAQQAAQQRQSLESECREALQQATIFYSAGNMIQTTKWLSKILAHPSSSPYAEAKRLQQEVQQRLGAEIDEKLNQARNALAAERFLEAQSDVQDILTALPQHAEAKATLQRIAKERHEKAQLLYREGYTFENLVQDFAAAKVSYQKVLDLLPDSQESYHQKAKARLDALN